MKRLMIVLSALFMMGGGAMAQKVTVTDVEAVPGETVAFSLSLSEGRADSYTGLMFDVQFPAEGFTTTGNYTVSSAWPGASAVVGDVDETGLASIPFASANEIAGSEVDDLLTVSFKVDESVDLGYYDVTLKNIRFEYGGMEALKDYASDVTFRVRVVQTHVIVLDEASTEVPEAAENVKVQVLRTFAADEWSTICLPFSMTEAQCKAAFGDDVQLADFTGCSVDDETGDITVNFTYVTAIEANHPYIIKVSAPITDFTVDGVDIAPEDDPCVDRDEETTGSGRNKKTTYNSFIGTYVAETVIPDYALFLSDNQFWFSTGNTRMKAFRAYFDLATAGAEYEDAEAAARVFMAFDKGITTGIGNLTPALSEGEGVYYNLKGQRVAQPSKGLYIVDGKKVVLK